jgi:hypothetical protein
MNHPSSVFGVSMVRCGMLDRIFGHSEDLPAAEDLYHTFTPNLVTPTPRSYPTQGIDQVPGDKLYFLLASQSASVL